MACYTNEKNTIQHSVSVTAMANLFQPTQVLDTAKTQRYFSKSVKTAILKQESEKKVIQLKCIPGHNNARVNKHTVENCPLQTKQYHVCTERKHFVKPVSVSAQAAVKHCIHTRNRRYIHKTKNISSFFLEDIAIHFLTMKGSSKEGWPTDPRDQNSVSKCSLFLE